MLNEQWEPYVTVVMSVMGGPKHERDAVRKGIVSDFGEQAWRSILAEATERHWLLDG